MRADFHDGREQTFPSKGRIQMSKTNNLHIVTSSLHRTAGPYKWVTNVISDVSADVRLPPDSYWNSDRPDGRKVPKCPDGPLLAKAGLS
jgi:hypothetical protein